VRTSLTSPLSSFLIHTLQSSKARRLYEVKTLEKKQRNFGTILANFPPVFYQWFLLTFPDPSAWFTSRLAFSRTLAVMSIVGAILGYVGEDHVLVLCVCVCVCAVCVVRM
jgi:phosphatidylinositol kinase/protein kinase (PI-3  family)